MAGHWRKSCRKAWEHLVESTFSALVQRDSGVDSSALLSLWGYFAFEEEAFHEKSTTVAMKRGE
jgi:hypothetical protein